MASQNLAVGHDLHHQILKHKELFQDEDCEMIRKLLKLIDCTQ